MVSLIVRGFDIGLKPLLADFVQFYRELLQPVYELLRRIPLPFEITPSMVDLCAAYLALLGLSVRAEFSPAREHNLKIFVPRPLGFLYSNEWEPQKWKQVLKSIALVPVLFLQPFVDLIPYLAHANEIRSLSLENYTGLEPDLADQLRDRDRKAYIERQKGWTPDVVQNICMFIAFPIAIILFFVLNEYGVW